MKQLGSIVSRILFAVAFVLAGLAVWEKLSNLFGLTLLRGYYSPARFLEISIVALVFVIALQLREIKISLEK
jgi:hypothetical protein